MAFDSVGPATQVYGTVPNLNIKDMQTRVMYGIPLVDQNGNPFPDDIFQSYLDSAIAWAEQTLGISITQRNVPDEFHDFIATDYMNWSYIKLWRKPVLEVISVDMYYGPSKMFTIPKDWLKIDNLAGTIQMFPYAGSAGQMIIGAGGSIWLPIMGGAIGYAPQMWHVNYDCGMTEPSGQIFSMTDIHPNLKEVIYKRAAIGVMQIWGDLIIGAGIASMSTSIDGIMQSIDTTQSAEYGGASARIKQMQTDIDNLLPVLRSYYDGMNMVVI